MTPSTPNESERTLTDAQLAAELLQIATYLPPLQAGPIREAAQRLDREISEAMVERAAIGIINAQRLRYGFEPMQWNDPNLTLIDKNNALKEARAALTAALSGKEE